MEDESKPDGANSGELEMTWEEAATTLKAELDTREHHITDNVYPWWKTLRKPFIILSIVIATLCASVIFLAITVRTLTNERNKATEQDACYDAYTAISGEAIARVRAAATRVDSAGWTALIRSASGEPLSHEDVETLEKLTEEAEEAVNLDREQVAARDAWVDNGRPLPCPVVRPVESE